VRYLLLSLFIFILSCVNLPKEKFNQFDLGIELLEVDGVTQIQFKNYILAPLRIWISSEIDTIQNQLDESGGFLMIEPLSDTIVYINGVGLSKEDFSFRAGLGDPNQEVLLHSLALPFQKGASFRLMQGYNSKPSHNTDYSRYALDFDMQIGDTICAATSGYVVGVIEEYSKGGKSTKWRPYANFITIYDPVSGIYTQYVHLDYMGSIVELGDTVVTGQAIGISGNTGYSTDPHLHFNVLKTVDTKQLMVSMPLDSIGDYKISELRRGQLLSND
jgi:murein DD-endopeptidase MepM/ murein hydrolase activator NlpD